MIDIDIDIDIDITILICRRLNEHLTTKDNLLESTLLNEPKAMNDGDIFNQSDLPSVLYMSGFI